MTDPILHIIDVGHGNSSVLIDDNAVVIFDAGPKTSLLEFLRQEKIDRVNTVLISHADQDHIEGLVSLIESKTVSIGAVRLNTDLVKDSQLWSDLIYLLDTEDRSGRIDFDVALTTKNSSAFSSPNVEVEILAPTLAIAGTGVGSKRKGRRTITSNGISAVIRLLVQGVPKVLLCGDMNADSLTEILERHTTLEASIVIYPHHGGRSEGSDVVEFARKLVNVTAAQVFVFSIGRGRYGTPIPEVVKEIRRAVPDVRIACTQLSEHCAADLPEAEPTHLNVLFATGRESKCCCAGTLSVRLTATEDLIVPLAATHREFIDRHIVQALCRKANGS